MTKKLSLKTKIFLGVAVLVFAGASVAWYQRLQNERRVAELEGRLRAAGYILSVAEFDELMPPENQNAAIALIKFFEKMDWWDQDKTATDTLFSLKTKTRFVAAFGDLEKAVSLPKNTFPAKYLGDQDMTYCLASRNAVIILCSLAEDAAKAKQTAMALKYYEVSRKIADLKFPIPVLVGGIEHRLAVSMSKSLTADPSLLPGLEALLKSAGPVPSERESIQYTLLLSLGWSDNPAIGQGIPSLGKAAMNSIVREELLKYFIEVHKRLPDSLDIKGNQDLQKWSVAHFETSGPTAEFAGFLASPNFSWLTAGRPLTMRRLIGTRLALEKTYRATGKYPATLENKPEFTDPCSGKPFKLSNMFGEPIIYSFGENLVDDNGGREDWVLWHSAAQSDKSRVTIRP